MLRDIPAVYLIFLIFGLVLFAMLVSYTADFIRGGDMLSLNDIVLTSAISKVDQLSRIKEGTLVLEDTFEMKAWEELVDKYPKGSEIRFDYLFDSQSQIFQGQNVPEKRSSELYKIGGSTPSTSSAVFSDLPVKAVRVLVRKTGDNATAGSNGWTYTSTIKLDVAEDD